MPEIGPLDRCREERLPSGTVYRHCRILLDVWGPAPWIRADRCGECRGAGAQVPAALYPTEENVCGMMLRIKGLRERHGKTPRALAARIVARAGKDRLAARLVQAVRAGGIAADEAAGIAGDHGIDVDIPRRTGGG